MKKVFLFFGLILFASCHSEKKQELMVKDLMEADRAFSDLSVEKGMKHAFIHFCASEGVLLRENAWPIEGQSSIISYLSRIDDETFILSWEPVKAVVAKSGDLGYTYGIFKAESKGNGVSEKGTYVSIWTREEEEWKWVLDTGNNGVGE